MRRAESVAVVAGVLLLVVVPVLARGGPTAPREIVGLLLLSAAGLALVGWRAAPQVASALSLGLLLATVVVASGAWLPDAALVVLSTAAALLGYAWSGRQAVVAGAVAVGYLAVLVALSGPGNEVALPMFTVPAYVAGQVLRQRRDTADELAVRAAELEREQAELEELSVRQERRRIAAELHDVVGHALSVLVIQAAAGQRLVDTAPARVEGTLEVIAESARRGAADLERLVDLLGGTPKDPDLALIDDVVAHAVRSGLDVTYRMDADRAAVPDAVAHLVHRVVREGLTNALRYAPGAPVRITVGSASSGVPAVTVCVENDRPTAAGSLRGSGSGLAGLRSRVQARGGRLDAGPTARGGWSVDVLLPLGGTG